MCSNGFRILIMFLFTALSFALNAYIADIPVIFWYLISINIFSFILFGIDKLNAKKDRARVSEYSFYYISFIGGVIGILSGALIFRHKLNKRLFLLAEFCIFLFWALLVYLVSTNFEAITDLLK